MHMYIAMTTAAILMVVGEVSHAGLAVFPMANSHTVYSIIVCSHVEQKYYIFTNTNMQYRNMVAAAYIKLQSQYRLDKRHKKCLSFL